jgi:hypothetical protein
MSHGQNAQDFQNNVIGPILGAATLGAILGEITDAMTGADADHAKGNFGELPAGSKFVGQILSYATESAGDTGTVTIGAVFDAGTEDETTATLLDGFDVTTAIDAPDDGTLFGATTPVMDFGPDSNLVANLTHWPELATKPAQITATYAATGADKTGGPFFYALLYALPISGKGSPSDQLVQGIAEILDSDSGRTFLGRVADYISTL